MQPVAVFLRYLPVTLVAASVYFVGIVDAAVIGTLGNPALIGGIAAAGTIVNFIFFTLNFLRGSTTALVAQAAGAGQSGEAVAVVLRAAVLALGLGAAAIVLQVAIGSAGLSLLGIEGEVATAAQTYFGIRIWSVPAMLCNFALVGWLLGQGFIVRAMLLQAATSLLNMSLCLLLVLHFRLGVPGVALATVTAEFTTASVGLLSLAVAVRRAAVAGLARRVFQADSIRRLVHVNGNMFLRSMALFVVMAFFTRASAGQGTAVLAVNAVLVNLFLVTASLMDGPATAAQHLTGRAVGARSAADFRSAARTTLLIGTSLSLAVAALLMLARPLVLTALASIEEVRAPAAAYYHWPLLAQLIGSVGFVCDGIFIGATWARDMRNLMLLAAAAFFAAWALLMPALGNHGLWLAFLVFQLTRGVSYVWRMQVLAPRTFAAQPG